MTGAAFLARRAGCVVVPAAISGHYRLFQRVTVRFGEPIQPTVDVSNEEFMGILMDHIAELLQENTK
jgi:1-acyl-sn-glycerol-3-phosphate acyltransferase